jgi:predicted RNA-binding Zn-ribbon protein involved in translation (DUF1610 family)
LTKALTKHFNIRRDRVPRFETVMPRIRAHYPYQEAGLSWILMDALEAFADLLDARAASEKPVTIMGHVFADEEGMFVDWTCPNCGKSNLTRPDDGTPTCGGCSTEVILNVWPRKVEEDATCSDEPDLEVKL